MEVVPFAKVEVKVKADLASAGPPQRGTVNISAGQNWGPFWG